MDVQAAFAREFLRPALQAGALRTRALVDALVAPIVARTLVEVARIEQAEAIAYGAGGPAAARLGASIAALSPAATVIAVGDAWTTDAAEQIEYARLRNVLCAPDTEDAAPPPAAAGDEPAHVDIRFDRGAPVALNGIEMPLQDLVATLGTIAAARGISEPAPLLLHAAHAALRANAEMDLESAAFAATIEHAYAALLEDGRWFSALRRALDAAVAVLQEEATGTARLTLFAGRHETSARRDDRPTLLPMASR
jgi:argininosuccinate synthase